MNGDVLYAQTLAAVLRPGSVDAVGRLYRTQVLPGLLGQPAFRRLLFLATADEEVLTVLLWQTGDALPTPPLPPMFRQRGGQWEPVTLKPPVAGQWRVTVGQSTPDEEQFTLDAIAPTADPAPRTGTLTLAGATAVIATPDAAIWPVLPRGAYRLMISAQAPDAG